MSVNQPDDSLADKTEAVRMKCRSMVDRLVALKSKTDIRPSVRMEMDVLISKFRACERNLAENVNDPESLKQVVFELMKLTVKAYAVALLLGP